MKTYKATIILSAKTIHEAADKLKKFSIKHLSEEQPEIEETDDAIGFIAPRRYDIWEDEE